MYQKQVSALDRGKSEKEKERDMKIDREKAREKRTGTARCVCSIHR